MLSSRTSTEFGGLLGNFVGVQFSSSSSRSDDDDASPFDDESQTVTIPQCLNNNREEDSEEEEEREEKGTLVVTDASPASEPVKGFVFPFGSSGRQAVGVWERGGPWLAVRAADSAEKGHHRHRADPSLNRKPVILSVCVYRNYLHTFLPHTPNDLAAISSLFRTESQHQS
jgi:hypothetical protein